MKVCIVRCKKLICCVRSFKVKGEAEGEKGKTSFLETSVLFSHWPPALHQQASDVPDVLVPHINWLIKAVLLRWTMFGLSVLHDSNQRPCKPAQNICYFGLSFEWERNTKAYDFALLPKKKHVFPPAHKYLCIICSHSQANNNICQPYGARLRMWEERGGNSCVRLIAPPLPGFMPALSPNWKTKPIYVP